MTFTILALACKKPDIFSRLIMWAMKTDYSHCAIVAHAIDYREDDIIYHCTAEGFHAERSKKYLEDHIVRHEFKYELSTYKSLYAWGWLDGCIGTQYSRMQFIGFIFPFLKPFVANNRDRMICSEAAGDFMKDCLGIKDSRLNSCDFVTPKDIVEICEANNK